MRSPTSKMARRDAKRDEGRSKSELENKFVRRFCVDSNAILERDVADPAKSSGQNFVLQRLGAKAVLRATLCPGGFEGRHQRLIGPANDTLGGNAAGGLTPHYTQHISIPGFRVTCRSGARIERPRVEKRAWLKSPWQWQRDPRPKASQWQRFRVNLGKETRRGSTAVAMPNPSMSSRWPRFRYRIGIRHERTSGHLDSICQSDLRNAIWNPKLGRRGLADMSLVPQRSIMCGAARRKRSSDEVRTTWPERRSERRCGGGGKNPHRPGGRIETGIFLLG